MDFHRACWLHRFPDSPDGIKTIVERLSKAEFDLLIPCVKQPNGICDFHTEVGNTNDTFRDFDPLMILAEESAPTGLSVHAWCCVFPEGDHSALLESRPEFSAIPGDEWELGEPQFRWACPNRPEVRDYEAAIYQELIDRYPIEGVHLDYIRYSQGLCFCPHCREDYAEKVGGNLEDLGVFDWNDPDADDMDRWIRWRCGVITRFVQRIREAANAKDKELSAAVFSHYPGTLQEIGQDWESWVREELLDYVFPMNYSYSTEIASKWARNHISTLAGASEDCRLWEGLHRHASYDTPRFIQHVEEVLETGVDGIVIFEYPNITDPDLKALQEL
ncbi:MAG: family 10 glycosylhydrolase [Candidatus Brocadiia bacterium]